MRQVCSSEVTWQLPQAGPNPNTAWMLWPVTTMWQSSLMWKAKLHVLHSDWFSWAYHEWEERWKEAHKSHVVQYPLSTTAEESESSFWGSACNHAFHLLCLQEGCWDGVCRAAPWKKPGGVFSWGLSLIGLLGKATAKGWVDPWHYLYLSSLCLAPLILP